MNAKTLACTLSILALCSGAAAQGALIVVDAAGGAGSQAVEIAEAVAMAPPGAMILVRAGIYAPFTVTVRTLVIAAEDGATVTVDSSLAAGPAYPPAVIVRDVPAGEVVVLEGLKFQGMVDPFSPGSGAASVEDCAGQVWFQDCTLSCGFGPGAPLAGLRVTGSHDVLLTHATVLGRSYIVPQTSGNWLGVGLHATDSRVFAFETSFVGGSGGAGVLMDDGFLFAEHGSIQGGAGVGIDFGFGCLLSVNGGPGLSLGAGSPTAIVLDTPIAGGPPDFFNGCSFAGPATSIASGTLQQLPGLALAFDVDSPARDGSAPTLSLTGPPGDMAAILMATSLPPVAWFAKYSGALATGGPMLFLIGPLPPAGTLTIPLHFGDALLPGTGSSIFMQCAVLHAGGGGLLGGAAVLTTYDG